MHIPFGVGCMLFAHRDTGIDSGSEGSDGIWGVQPCALGRRDDCSPTSTEYKEIQSELERVRCKRRHEVDSL